MRRPRAIWLFWASVVIVAVLGLIPFTVRVGRSPSPKLVSHCRGALLEVWPERNPNGGGWFSYAPNSGTVITAGHYKAIVCGHEARRRAIVPLLAISLLAVAITVRQSSRQEPGSGPVASESG